MRPGQEPSTGRRMRPGWRVARQLRIRPPAARPCSAALDVPSVLKNKPAQLPGVEVAVLVQGLEDGELPDAERLPWPGARGGDLPQDEPDRPIDFGIPSRDQPLHGEPVIIGRTESGGGHS